MRVVALLARQKINLRKTQFESVAAARSLPLPVRVECSSQVGFRGHFVFRLGTTQPKVVRAVALLARLKINLRKTQVESVAAARSLPLPVL